MNPVDDAYPVAYDKVIGQYRGRIDLNGVGILFANRWLLLGLVMVPMLFFVFLDFRHVLQQSDSSKKT